MQIYASAQSQSFYIEGVHKYIPRDAVEISAELYEELLDHRSGGLDIDFTTVPPSVKEREIVALTDEQLAFSERLWRDTEISTTEWLTTRHRDQQNMQLPTMLTAEQFTELLLYRQTLRDWPQTEAFPDSAQRPIAPLWLADQSQ